MPPADGSSTVAYRFAVNQAICVSPWIKKITADLRSSADGSAVRTSVVAKLQAASVPNADSL